jgi:hypothetical protein
LASVGAAAAGVAVGLRPGRARAAGSSLGSFYRDAYGMGKPMLVVTLLSREEEDAFKQARDAIALGASEDAVRLTLVEICVTNVLDAVLELTNASAQVGPPSLALVDGAPARLIKEEKLDRTQPYPSLLDFLREAVPLTVAWLQPRAARASRQHGDQVRTIRRRIAAGAPVGDLGQQIPAVVALEAIRREKDRARLFADLLPAPPPPPPAPKPRKGEEIDQCGLGFKMLTPLGLRFLDAFTKLPPVDGERGRKA